MSVDTIVVGVDGSEGSARAMNWTAGLAQRLGARVIAIHVFEPLAHLGTTSPPYQFDQIEIAVRTRLESEWTAPLASAGVDHEARVLHGTPFGCLVDAAAEVDADLIVVGARGYGLLRGLALGSTSEKLLHTSKRPVAVIPPL